MFWRRMKMCHSSKLLCPSDCIGLLGSRFFHLFCSLQSNSKLLSSSEIRKAFLDFFVNDYQHTFVPSSPVFLKNDRSLLFVNAGMNQFKPLFLGTVDSKSRLASLKRAANSQKCIRVGGKHNDLDDVGKDLHHHTFFEMLGNWSFGDYFKKEACSMAFELLTKRYNVPVNKLFVTYFGGDHVLQLEPDTECREIWLEIGFPSERVIPVGIQDNFWEMGETGPCGPCTEVHYDHADFFQNNPSLPSQSVLQAQGVTELWNLVFIQYERHKDGKLKLLPSQHVDTGMGMERITALLQGSASNYDTDLFKPIIDVISKASQVKAYEGKTGVCDVDGIDASYRVVADHARMFSIAIADGVLPDVTDAGNVLRKIIKEAVFHSQRLRCPPGMLASLVYPVTESLGHVYPELSKNVKLIHDTVSEEEERTLQHFDRAMASFKEMSSCVTASTLPGEKVWELYSGYGMPRSVIEDAAKQVGLKVDWPGFNKLLSEQQEKTAKSKSVIHNSSFSTVELQSLLKEANVKPTDDTFKYDYAFEERSYRLKPLQSEVVALVSHQVMTSRVNEGEKCFVLVDKTCYYAEKGGQVSDIGHIVSENAVFKVENVISLQDYVLHQGFILKGYLNVGDTVSLHVDESHRNRCMQNHTASHLLNAALRKLIPQTCQQSSYVGPDFLRFNFSAKEKLSVKELETVEDLIRELISAKCPVKRETVPLSVALRSSDVIFLPDEVYPDPVILVIIGDKSLSLSSCELCCGTHLHNVAHLEDFLIVDQKSEGQAVKSIYAVTGKEVGQVKASERNIEMDVHKLEADAEQQGSKEISYRNYKDIAKLLQDVKDIRTHLQHERVGFHFRHVIEDKLEKIEKNIKSDMKKHQKIKEKKLQQEFEEVLETHLNQACIIHKVGCDCDIKVITKLALHIFAERPYLLFVESENKYLRIQCRIPQVVYSEHQDLVTPEFDAQRWVSSLSDAIAIEKTFSLRNPQLFMEGIGRLKNQLSEALEAGKRFFDCRTKKRQLVTESIQNRTKERQL